MADTPDEGAESPSPRPKKQASGPSRQRRSADTKAPPRPRPRSKPTSDAEARGTQDGTSRRRVGTAELALAAAEQLLALTGKSFEGIVGLRRNEDGWDVEVEVVEMRRIPETTDVIAVYRVRVDSSGELLDYERVHRYQRGQAGEER